jgi:hypothetical protein
VKVVILSRKLSNAEPLVASIKRLDPRTPIIVVDDGLGKKMEGIAQIEGVKPFIFSRNANIGIRHADDDVVLMNDDTELISEMGLTLMERQSPSGITSARVIGPWTHRSDFVSFVCVLIPQSVQRKVGLLDERFVKYGYEDDDYCRRVIKENLPINVFNDCVVKHFHPDRSTFHGLNNLYDGDNLVEFDLKWAIKREYTWPEHLEQIKNAKH